MIYRMKKRLVQPVFMAVGLTYTILLPQASMAGITGVRTSSSGAGQVGNSTTIRTGAPLNEKVELQEGTAKVACKQDPNESTYFPLDFFSQITRDGSTLTFEKRADNKILVKVPASIDSCGKFKPQLIQDPTTKNVTIMMQNEEGKTYKQFIDCLEVKNILNDGKINHDTIDGKEYSEYSYVLDYKFEKNSDIKKSIKLTYGYPRAFSERGGYVSTFGIDNDVELPSSLCMSAENIQSKVTYLNKGQDALIEELKEICKSGDAQRIAEARRSIPNLDPLVDIAEKIKAELDAGYLVAVKQDVDKIFSRMTKIEEKLNKDKDTIDESSAKKLAKEYAELSKELDSKFLNAAIYRLDTLMKNRESLGDEDPKLKTIDEEINKLNEDISAFSKKRVPALAGLYAVMEKYALTDSAKTIEDIQLKSFYYGKVYPGPADDKKGKALTFEEANKKQVEGIEKFERVLTDWNDVYRVGKGDLAPIEKTKREAMSTYEKMNRRWYDYQNAENEKYKKYCSLGWTGSVNNPIQCQAFMAGAEARRAEELKRRETDLKYINSRDAKMNRMGTFKADYDRRKVAADMKKSDAFESYGSSFASYDDNYSNQLYMNNYAPQSMAYSPYMYQMNPGQQPMNMGANQMMYPSMVNPNMPIQPGQFQMNPAYMNNQSMGWPTI